MFDVACAGLLVSDTFCGPIANLPTPGELLITPPFTIRSGGCAANVSIGLSKLGVSSRVLGKVGQDPAGYGIAEDLKSRGIDIGGIIHSPTYPTSQTVALLCRDEDRRFLHNFGANAELTVNDIESMLETMPPIFYVGGYLGMPKLESEELSQLLQRLQSAGVTTVLDIVTPSDLNNPEPLWAILPHIDLFMPNDDEALLCTGLKDPPDQARALQERGVKTTIVTLGSSGSIIDGQEGRWRIGSYPSECVDPSGGGDAFAAGVIRGLREDWPITRCAQLGAIVGGSCVQTVGCHDGIYNAHKAFEELDQSPPPVEPLP